MVTYFEALHWATTHIIEVQLHAAHKQIQTRLGTRSQNTIRISFCIGGGTVTFLNAPLRSHPILFTEYEVGYNSAGIVYLIFAIDGHF